MSHATTHPLRLLLFALVALPLALAARPATAQDPAVKKAADEIDQYKEDSFEQPKRAAAIKDLVRMNSKDAVRAILPVMNDPYVHLRELIRLYVSGAPRYGGGIRSAEAVDTFINEGLKQRDETIRKQVAMTLARMAGNTEVEARVDTIAEFAGKERSGDVKALLCEALGKLGKPTTSVIDTLVVESKRGNAQGAAAIALARLGKFDDIEKPDKLLKDKDAKLWMIDACAIAGKMLPEAIAAGLDKSERDERVRIAAVEAIAALHPGEPDGAVTFLMNASQDKSLRVRAAAIDTCLDIWAANVIPVLIDRLEHEEGRLQLDAFLALRVMTKKEFGFDAVQWKTWWNSQKDKFVPVKKPDDKWGPQLLDPSNGAGTAGEKSTATFFNIPIVTTAPIFCFDVSGSMKNPASPNKGITKIEYACDHCLAALQNVPEKTKFNILLWRYWSGFPPETEAQWSFPRMVPANRKTLQEAKSFVGQIEPKGWGDFYGALTLAFADPDVDTIFFLSDGGASRGEYVVDDELIDALVKANRFHRVVVHTVLTGTTGADAKFMQNLSNATGGIFRMVDPAKD
ncbi:MAG: hypothetical protein AB7K09_15025 [Planctomycetota bacterium]